MESTKAERQERRKEMDKNREANAAKRQAKDHARFLTNHMPGTVLMFAAKLVRNRSGRRLEWHQQKLLMWSQDYEVTKKFVHQKALEAGAQDHHSSYWPVQIERIFLIKLGGHWHRVYASRFVLGDLKQSEPLPQDAALDLKTQATPEPYPFEAPLVCTCQGAGYQFGADCPIHSI